MSDAWEREVAALRQRIAEADKKLEELFAARLTARLHEHGPSE
jgi:hypothetical protein